MKDGIDDDNGVNGKCRCHNTWYGLFCWNLIQFHVSSIAKVVEIRNNIMWQMY